VLFLLDISPKAKYINKVQCGRMPCCAIPLGYFAEGDQRESLLGRNTLIKCSAAEWRAVLCISFFEEEGEDMPLVTSREMLTAAYSRQYAVGAFNAHNLETVAAIVEAAEEERAPVFIQFSRSSIEYAGLEAASNLAKTAAQRVSVPVVLHLDHGMDVSLNVRCLRAGFTSLMCDGTELFLQRYKQESGDGTLSFDMIVDKVQSREAYEENLRQTRKVVGLAHACGVPVLSLIHISEPTRPY